MEQSNDWEVSYKLAVLRHVPGMSLDRLPNIDLSTVNVSTYGSGGWDSGCDTCGSSPGSITATVYWTESGDTKYYTWDGEEAIAELIQSFSEA